MQGLVQPEALANECVVRRVPMFACERKNGVTWGKVDEEEPHEENAGHRRDDLEQPKSNVSDVHRPQLVESAKCPKVLKLRHRVRYARVPTVSTSQK